MLEQNFVVGSMHFHVAVLAFVVWLGRPRMGGAEVEFEAGSK